MSTTTTNAIEKQILLRAPRARVWRAISDSKEFGTWFQAAIDGPFVPGRRVTARITYPGYEHLVFEIIIERMEPERLFSYRWHPNAIDPGVDYSSEPMTLVEFTLEEAEGGTLLTVTETGFEHIPLARRAAALKGNESGWAGQMTAIDAYLRKNS
jgi:uncharacterized protein YndB with AHSA1/START domain